MGILGSVTPDRVLDGFRTAAERTPRDRERHVDLIRAVSIGFVVLGHWTVIVIVDNGGLDGVNALGEVGWFHPLTWLFQVMPLFFFVGGYANAASLDSHRRRGGDPWVWTAERFARLVLPAAAMLGVVVAAVAVAGLVGVPAEDRSVAVWFVTVPLWFLLAYLAVSALAPGLTVLDARAGLRGPTVLGGLVVVIDIGGLALDVPHIRQVNHLLVFVVFHQLGVAWRHGSLPARPRVGLPLTVSAIVAASVVVAGGPHPVSMVDVPGAPLQNTSPPTAAFLLLGLAQIGVVLATRDRLRAWLSHPRVWTTVVAINAAILTIFLWHVAAALLAGLVLHVAGLLPTAPIGSGRWVALRLPWIAASLVALTALVVVFAPVERAASRPPSTTDRPTGSGRAILGFAMAAVLVGLAGIAATGPGDPARLGVPWWSLVAFAAGTFAVTSVRAGWLVRTDERGE